MTMDSTVKDLRRRLTDLIYEASYLLVQLKDDDALDGGKDREDFRDNAIALKNKTEYILRIIEVYI